MAKAPKAAQAAAQAADAPATPAAGDAVASPVADATGTPPAETPAATPPAPLPAEAVLLLALLNIDHDGDFYPEGSTLAVLPEFAERLIASGSAREA